jgi:hypothetical protein
VQFGPAASKVDACQNLDACQETDANKLTHAKVLTRQKTDKKMFASVKSLTQKNAFFSCPICHDIR